jgi:hypothetical protein
MPWAWAPDEKLARAMTTRAAPAKDAQRWKKVGEECGVWNMNWTPVHPINLVRWRFFSFSNFFAG